MKRVIVALLIGGALFGAIYGLAAGLNVEGGTIQAGSDVDLICDEDGVQVLGWSLETNDGNVYAVRIGNIDEQCAGNDIFVSITDTGVEIADGDATIETDAADGGDGCTDTDAAEVCTRIQIPGGVPAEDITDIEVFIEGPSNG
jgi:hypothetical protein